MESATANNDNAAPQHASPSELAFRPPTVSGKAAPPTYSPPPLDFLIGKWHVTHSSLPMWRSKRNVTITYTPISGSDDRLESTVAYQPLSGGDKVSTVVGVEKAANAARDSWDWRGKGWLMIASSHWEVLGYGTESGTGNQWAVTYFAKTLFTPAGVDFYCKGRKGLREDTIAGIKEGLGKVDSPEVRKLVGEVFVVAKDD